MHINIGHLAALKANLEDRKYSSFTYCSLLDIIEGARSVLTDIDSKSNNSGVTWNVDLTQLARSKKHISSPKTVYYLLLNLIQVRIHIHAYVDIYKY
jgi:hypothetical protein